MRNSRTTTAAIGFRNKIWGIAPKSTEPTSTKLNVNRPPATPLKELTQMFRLITQ
jgi:hypothetical protein